MQLRPEVNSYRLWSPRFVLDGIGTLVEDYGIRNIKIADELFVLRPKHVEQICEGIVQRGYDLNIWAYSRVDTLRQPMVERLKSAGVNWLAFGIEAATERVRDDVQKGFSAEKLSGTLDLVRQAGINVIANYIFGLPEDDQDSMQATLELAQELNCEFANFYCTMAYPGSALYRQAIDKGWRLPQSWSGYAQHAVDTLPLPTNHLTAAEVLRFRDRAFNTYFGSPRYLNMVTTKFGEQTSTHLRNMLTHKLERRFA